MKQLDLNSHTACERTRQEREDALVYAIARLAMPNVSIYLDAGHAVGDCWDGSRAALLQTAERVLVKAGGLDSVRGFVTNLADYVPLEGDDVQRMNAKNPCHNAVDYVKKLALDLRSRGITDKGFLIDTSRNGRGGIRSSGWDWCNLVGAGLGERPRAAPRILVDAYVWALPPGESNGTDAVNAARFEATCTSPNSRRGAPDAGRWFDAAFAELARNANPPL